MADQKDARSSATKEDTMVGGDSEEYQEEMALAVDMFAEQMQARWLVQQAMLADLEEARKMKGTQGKNRSKPKRPRRMEQILQGLFEYIDMLAREDVKEAEEDEDFDEKGKGKAVDGQAKRNS
ncbi:hypothetical protein CALCODRAFT_509317 [Calocera cornea HHB12733]|uniref:Uncharacterized protein n=1 Tax=Calocera cornea HHB12733 TaxID=1353952 RepID=A0A165FF11_9BASI|nr:hypothetical protein CALCODRAFT_509317 [Calocera cornea HHB12733]